MMKREAQTLRTRRMLYAALYLALALVLPFLTAQIPQVGKALSPMHIPALLCGFTCGWPYGLVVGALAPILRSTLFGMPVLFPTAIAMAFELAAYGTAAGLLYRVLQEKRGGIYLTLILSMVIGRLVWGCAQFTLLQMQGKMFTLSMFMKGAVLSAVPGIILHLILIPVIVVALRKARLMLN